MYEFLKDSQNIKASDNLKKRVSRTLNRSKRTAVLKTCGLGAAAAVLAFTVCTNVSPDFAYAMSDIPVIGGIVRVVTLDRYSAKIGGSDANIVTPKIEGLSDTELMDKINAELGENANALKSQFEADAKELEEVSGGEGHMGFVYDYRILTDTPDYYVVDIFYENIAGSSSTTHKFYTIDRKENRLVTLSGLFKDGADYTGRLSEIIKDEMIRRNKEEDGMFWVEADEFSEGFTGISPEQNFYINENGDLVICFDKYEVAAGAQGCPEFIIPKDKIADILA